MALFGGTSVGKLDCGSSFSDGLVWGNFRGGSWILVLPLSRALFGGTSVGELDCGYSFLDGLVFGYFRGGDGSSSLEPSPYLVAVWCQGLDVGAMLVTGT